MKKLSVLITVIFSIMVLNFSVALAVAPGGSTTANGCTAGCPGSTSCTITYEISGGGGGAGGGASATCNVSCSNGYYSCCKLVASFPFVSCTCIGNS